MQGASTCRGGARGVVTGCQIPCMHTYIHAHMINSHTHIHCKCTHISTYVRTNITHHTLVQANNPSVARAVCLAAIITWFCSPWSSHFAATFLALVTRAAVAEAMTLAMVTRASCVLWSTSASPANTNNCPPVAPMLLAQARSCRRFYRGKG